MLNHNENLRRRFFGDKEAGQEVHPTRAERRAHRVVRVGAVDIERQARAEVHQPPVRHCRHVHALHRRPHHLRASNAGPGHESSLTQQDSQGLMPGAWQHLRLW